MFYRYWFGLHICGGHSPDAEWLAKLTFLHTLRHRRGDILLASDSTVALLCDLTYSPPHTSALAIPYRNALLMFRAALYEVWLPAQHDTGDIGLLSALSAESDALARERIREALPLTAPWLPQFQSRVLATHQRALILNPPKACERIYADTAQCEFSARYPAPSTLRMSAHVCDSLEHAAVPPLAVLHILQT